jgi:hypothetical protein
LTTTRRRGGFIFRTTRLRSNNKALFSRSNFALNPPFGAPMPKEFVI